MTAKEYTGDRKRSRPVTKRSMGDKMKKRKIRELLKYNEFRALIIYEILIFAFIVVE